MDSLSGYTVDPTTAPPCSNVIGLDVKLWLTSCTCSVVVNILLVDTRSVISPLESRKKDVTRLVNLPGIFEYAEI